MNILIVIILDSLKLTFKSKPLFIPFIYDIFQITIEILHDKFN
jgi:hypothetical protein